MLKGEDFAGNSKNGPSQNESSLPITNLSGSMLNFGCESFFVGGESSIQQKERLDIYKRDPYSGM